MGKKPIIIYVWLVQKKKHFTTTTEISSFLESNSNVTAASWLPNKHVDDIKKHEVEGKLSEK